MYTLFAYTRAPGQRIVRFAVDQAVQRELTAYLDSQVDFFDLEREIIVFDGKYKPDGDEMLVIEEFDDIDNLAAAVLAPLNIPIADPADFSFDQIRALFFGKTVNGETSVYLQTFDRRKLISEAGFSIFHSNNVYKRIEGTGLTLDVKIAAKLEGNSLKFFSFFLMRQMFDMSSYYQEATDADIAEFASLPKVVVQDQDALIAASDNWVRKKLWLIKQSGILDKVVPADLKVIAAEFGIQVVYVDDNGSDRLQLPTDKKQLKTLLRFLDEDYYKSPLSRTNFITNSKRAV